MVVIKHKKKRENKNVVLKLSVQKLIILPHKNFQTTGRRYIIQINANVRENALLLTVIVACDSHLAD